MKVIEIKNIKRKDFPIYYRRLYTGVAVLDFASTIADVPVDFQIEHKPTGQVEIGLALKEKVDYPIIPLTKELKLFIGALDSSGSLPD
ncbi:MAG: hypothetical protein FWD91_06830 [Treponema sp.]|nr:hypothetical protein [Treponema sp.]